MYDVTGSGVPMRVKCTMPRHAIDDAHNSLLVPIIGPETVNLGCHRGRLDCVRSLTRSSPDNTRDRSDPIRSPDNDERVSSRPMSSSTANDRCPTTSANFPWCRKLDAIGMQNRDFLLRLPCAMRHAIGTPAKEDTYLRPPFCSMIAIVSFSGIT